MASSRSIDGETQLAAVIGSPVRHSRSPVIMNAAFQAAGMNWVFTAFEVSEADAPASVAAMRALGIRGLSVTMPLKAAVIPALDSLSGDAEALGAVNCIARQGDALVGHNTDGAGLVRSLQLDHGIDLADKRCVVLGAGGAARSVVLALSKSGVRNVAVINRSPERAEVAASLAGPLGSTATLEAVQDADVVINATSVGMGKDAALGESPVPVELLNSSQLIVDLVYKPLRTALLAQAQEVGATAVDGLGMLVHQAALAFEHWSSLTPDLEVMRRAAI